jgi:CBS domain-containing protein
MQTTVKSILEKKGKDIWAVTPDTTVYDTIAFMSEKSIGAVVIMENGQLLGILSERDYIRKVILEGRASKDTRADQIMTGKVIVAGSERTAEECMALMTDKRIRHLPIVDGETVIGVVSLGDVVKAVIETRGLMIELLERYITAP